MTDCTTRITAMAVGPAGAALFDERVTHVRLVDEADGEFVEVEQIARNDVGKIGIGREEWPALRDAIDRMIGECRDSE